MPSNLNYCTNCGEKIVSKEENQQKTSQSKKSVVIALIVAFFIGIGVLGYESYHHFALGEQKLSSDESSEDEANSFQEMTKQEALDHLEEMAASKKFVPSGFVNSDVDFHIFLCWRRYGHGDK